MMTKPHGIFTIEHMCITVNELDKTLDRLISLSSTVRQGERDGVWTWQECFIQMSNYLTIMKNEIKSIRH